MQMSNGRVRNIGARLGADAASAASASFLIAPIVTVIDRYVAIRLAHTRVDV